MFIRRRKGLRSIGNEGVGPRNWPRRAIRVNAINSGGIDTEGRPAHRRHRQRFERMIVAGTTLGRVDRPDDIRGPVSAVVFMRLERFLLVDGQRSSQRPADSTEARQ